jgi:hypothetical protein
MASSHSFRTTVAARTTPFSVVNLVLQKPLSRIDLGAVHGPHGIAFAGVKVHFTAETSKLIGRYDSASQRIDWLLGTGQNRTHMLVVPRDLDRIFTSNVNSGTITITEKTTFLPAAQVFISPYPAGAQRSKLLSANTRLGCGQVLDEPSARYTDLLAGGQNAITFPACDCGNRRTPSTRRRPAPNATPPPAYDCGKD